MYDAYIVYLGFLGFCLHLEYTRPSNFETCSMFTLKCWNRAKCENEGEKIKLNFYFMKKQTK